MEDPKDVVSLSFEIFSIRRSCLQTVLVCSNLNRISPLTSPLYCFSWRWRGSRNRLRSEYCTILILKLFQELESFFKL